MKGIILAGGSGTRLYPATCGISKQLIPVYDKPMIYYPLSVLMLSNIREIAIITTAQDQSSFKRLLGDGSQWGLSFDYIVQPSPEGLAQAFILAEDFLSGQPACLVLGDNIYYAHGLPELLIKAKNIVEEEGGAYVFGYNVIDPERYGVIEFSQSGEVLSIEEKPKKPKSHFAVTGLYYYDANVCKLAKKVKRSKRGELEISCLNQLYLEQSNIKVGLMGRGYAWFDTGTHDSMMEASQFIATIEHRQGLKIGCPEEIALQKKWINTDQLIQLAQPLKKTGYGRYLLSLI
ncbi:MAG: glucose-1-phosphate thymidylyltransferase [Gammaproteobacteria bacterium]|nr:MAG: glucose-1-phosphate thymidylyltransferase [Gammaproteobacteria bacterium]UTW42472.1 glucose-1-phosphate thymidylyltransferase RfbA [bacterium SCSIO 12844]